MNLQQKIGYNVSISNILVFDNPYFISYWKNTIANTAFFYFMVGKGVVEMWDIPVRRYKVSPKRFHDLMISPTYKNNKNERVLTLAEFPNSNFDPEKSNPSIGSKASLYGVEVLAVNMLDIC